MAAIRQTVQRFLKSYGVIMLFLVIGLLFRILLLAFVHNDPRYDIRGYSELAQDLLSGRLAADCCYKNPGYAFFLAPIYYFFGYVNFPAVGWFQIILDLGNSLLIYGIAKKIFSKTTALWAFLLYLMNPVAASYTGLVLPETVTITVLLVTGYIFSEAAFPTTPMHWALAGFSTGLLVVIRHQFYLFGIFLMILFTVMVLKKMQKMFFVLIFGVGFIIGTSYPLVGNYAKFKRISIVPPNNSPSLAVYNLFYRKGPYPEIAEDWAREPFDKEAFEAYMDFSKTPLNQLEEFNGRYAAQVRKNFAADPLRYMINYGKSMFWIWNKTHLFYYEDPLYRFDTVFIRISNVILLLFWCIGMGRFFFIKKMSALRNPIFLYSLLLFVYATFLFPLASAESRHTVFYTGFLTLWAGYGLNLFIATRTDPSYRP